MNETSNLLDNGETVSQEETESEQEEHDDVRELERQQVNAGFGFFHVVLLVVSGLATAADAVEIFGVSFVVPIADSDLHLDSGRKGWLDAIIFLGMMIGGYLWGGLADVIGRRPCLISAMLLNGVCGLASAFSVDFYMFLVLRLASGIGVGGSQPVVFSFVSEFFTEKQRGPMVILLASCWQPGIIFTALLAWVMLGIPQTESAISFYIGSLHIVNWRVFLMICTVPSFVSAASFLILPESPGFLYHAKRFDDVKKVLNRVWRLNSWCPCMWWKPTIPNQEDIRSLMGDESVELQVSREHGPSGETTDGVVDTEGAVEGASPLLVKTRIHSCFTSVSTKANKIIDASLGLFRWKYLRATLLLLIIWFTQSYGYYGLQLWFPEYFKRLQADSSSSGNFSNSTDNGDTNLQFYQDTLYVAIASLPGNIAGTILINFIGGRIQLTVAMILSALSVFSIWKVPNRHAVVLGVSCVFSAVTVTVFGSLDVCVMNIYETTLRSTAFGIHSGIGRIGAILGNVTFGHLIDSDRSLPILLVASFLGVGAIAAVFLPPVYRPENRPPLVRALSSLVTKCKKRRHAPLVAESYDAVETKGDDAECDDGPS